MTATEIADLLKAQARSSGALTLDDTLLAAADLTALRAALGLGAQDSLLISGVAEDDIAQSGEQVDVAVGAADVLRQTAASIKLRLTAGEPVRAVVQATMPTGWRFADSFPAVPAYPFAAIEADPARFVFATEATPWPWGTDPTDTVNVEPGLYFLGDATIAGLSDLGQLLGEDLAPSRRLFGPFTDAAGRPLPVGMMAAPLTATGFGVGVDDFTLTLSAPTLALGVPEVGEDEVQRVAVRIGSTLDDMLDVSVELDRSSALTVRATPSASAVVSATEMIEALPGGQGFVDYLPAEVASVFSDVGLKRFVMVADLTPAVRQVELVVGSSGTWPLLPGVLELGPLDLRVAVWRFGSASVKRVTLEAQAGLLESVFVTPFDFSVELEQSGSGWGVRSIGGRHRGGVTLGQLVGGLVGSPDGAPEALRAVTLHDFAVEVTRAGSSYNYTLLGGAGLDLDLLDWQLRASLDVIATKTAAGWDLAARGGLSLAEQHFSLQLDLNTTDTTLTAAWQTDGDPLGLDEIADALNLGLPQLPESLDLGLKSAGIRYDLTEKRFELTASSVNYGDASFVARSGAQGTDYALALAMNVDIDLGDLPLVGSRLPDPQALALRGLSAVYASAPFTAEAVAAINAGLATLPGSHSLPAGDLAAGPALTVDLVLGGTPRPLTVGAARTAAAPEEAQSTPTTPAADPTTRSPVQKSFGPVSVSSVSLSYESERLWIGFTGGFSLAGFSLSLDGLAVGISLSDPMPTFSLNGLGVDATLGSGTTIRGRLLRVPDPDGDQYNDQYNGSVVVQASKFTLSALGGFAVQHGRPSMFLYGVLNVPLGGPSFFFVTGLAAGFGYNRRLVLPAIEGVQSFPLVAAAVNNDPQPADPGAVLHSIGQTLPPSTGDNFVAVGLKFTSFKLIDSFALLTVAFGSRTEIGLLGLSSLVLPTPVPGSTATPLAVVELALKASFLPDEGTLTVRATLTDRSFLISRACRLRGGLAFSAWFKGEHEGDFVFTIGGYHPRYAVPAHYPQVPRLGLDWRVSSKLSVKGGLYAALTPNAAMAGGELEATWKDGSLSASFKAGAHFLISWKPYYYTADIHISMSVAYRTTIWLVFKTIHPTLRATMGASLKVWGPEFSGTAKVHFAFITVKVGFGPTKEGAPPLLGWDAFRQSFLPAEEARVCSVRALSGLVASAGADPLDLGTVHPAELALATDSAIPITAAVLKTSAGDEAVGVSVPNGLGVKAMGLSTLGNTQTVTIRKDGVVVGEHFAVTALPPKAVPKALWASPAEAAKKATRVIPGAVTGLRIAPRAPSTRGATQVVSREALAGERAPTVGRFAWEAPEALVEPALDDAALRQALRVGLTDTNPLRDSALEALGFTLPVAIQADYAKNLPDPPVVRQRQTGSAT
ncbi:MAG: hypothetical protein H6739_28035 [Alphaproteobacteria bacterium]|nr:hypothetical protein [Alphaproteobacteria bacterium]